MTKARKAFDAAFETIILYAQEAMDNAETEGHSVLVEIMREMGVKDERIAWYVMTAVETLINDGAISVHVKNDGVLIGRSELYADPEKGDEFLMWKPPSKELTGVEFEGATLSFPSLFELRFDSSKL
jgi:hypothetical protein